MARPRRAKPAAIAIAAAAIRRGESELAIAGGADAPITPLAIASFTTAGLSSCRNQYPERASRPFDRARDSGVISEGAGVVLLENLEHALARGAEPYCELTGYGLQMDTDPENPGSGLESTMSAALANAGCSPEEVDYICAYGPGHPIFDKVELAMIRRVFGAPAPSIPKCSASSTPPLAAAGPLQVIAAALSLQKGLIPPTANCENLDDNCELDIVRGAARRGKLSRVLINVRGLGGGNSTLLIERGIE